MHAEPAPRRPAVQVPVELQHQLRPRHRRRLQHRRHVRRRGRQRRRRGEVRHLVAVAVPESGVVGLRALKLVAHRDLPAGQGFHRVGQGQRHRGAAHLHPVRTHVRDLHPLGVQALDGEHVAQVLERELAQLLLARVHVRRVVRRHLHRLVEGQRQSLRVRHRRAGQGRGGCLRAVHREPDTAGESTYRCPIRCVTVSCEHLIPDTPACRAATILVVRACVTQCEEAIDTGVEYQPIGRVRVQVDAVAGGVEGVESDGQGGRVGQRALAGARHVGRVRMDAHAVVRCPGRGRG